MNQIAIMESKIEVLCKQLDDRDKEIARLEKRDEVWRAKKEMLENDLARAWKELQTEKLVWSIKEEQMRDNFQRCKDAAEYWKKKAEDLMAENTKLKEK